MKKFTSENVVTMLTLMGAAKAGHYGLWIDVPLVQDDIHKYYEDGIKLYAEMGSGTGAFDFGVHGDIAVTLNSFICKELEKGVRNPLTDEDVREVNEWISAAVELLDVSWKLDHNSRG